MTAKAFEIGPDEAGRTLLDVLAETQHVSGKSAKRLLDARAVFVNRRRVWMARHVVRRGDIIEIAATEAPAAHDIEVLHEDEDYLVVNKPPGMLSNGPDSVEEALRTARKRPALCAVHRLDRGTSGCLVLAKSKPAFTRMVALFRQHAVRKTYQAIVQGCVERTTQTISEPLEGRPAVTHVRLLDAGREASHLQLRIETGRTHQIRQHLAARRHAVIGDRRYGTRTRATDRTLAAGRQMLHASAIGFTHPGTGQPVQARAPLPRDFRRCLRAYRLG